MTDPKLTHDGEYNVDLPGGLQSMSDVHKQKGGTPNTEDGCSRTLGWGCLAMFILPIFIIGVFMVRHEVNKAVGHVPCWHFTSMSDFISRTSHLAIDSVTVVENADNQTLYVFDAAENRLCYLNQFNTGTDIRTAHPSVWYSPNGKYIAFTIYYFASSNLFSDSIQNQSGQYPLYVLNQETNKLRVVYSDDNVSWSSDTIRAYLQSLEADS